VKTKQEGLKPKDEESRMLPMQILTREQTIRRLAIAGINQAAMPSIIL
jgi:hypothetical protein